MEWDVPDPMNDYEIQAAERARDYENQAAERARRISQQIDDTVEEMRRLARADEPNPEPPCDASGDVPDEATLAALRELNAAAPTDKAPHCRCEPPLVGDPSRLDPRVRRALVEEGLTAAFGKQVQIDQDRAFLECMAGDEPPGPTILDEAAAAVDGDRERDYGHPLDDFSCVVELANALGFRRVDRTTGQPRPLEAEDHPIYLELVKLAREWHRPGRDNMVDGAGYWRTLEKVKAERERRERREGS